VAPTMRTQLGRSPDPLSSARWGTRAQCCSARFGTIQRKVTRARYRTPSFRWTAAFEMPNAQYPWTLRGIEGEAARAYFGVFNYLLTAQRQDFAFHERSRRPPLDNVNALLSFLYSILAHDARTACEAAGLDPAVGF